MRTSLLPLLAVAVAAASACHESPAEISPTPLTENLGAGSNDSSRMMRAMDPVARVLDQRQELGLSGSQIAQLESIQTRLAEQNNPLITQLQDLRPEGPRGPRLAWRSRSGERHRRMRELTLEEREEIRERIEAHREEMQNRTPEEREQLRSELRERHPEWAANREEAAARREEMREQMEELRPVLEQLRESNREARDEASAVLTEEQRSYLRSKREEMRERRRERHGQRFRMRFDPNGESDAGSDDVSR